jgi:hypothetical protein
MRSTGFNRGGVTSGEIVIVESSGTADLAGIEGSGIVLSGQAGPSGASGIIESRFAAAGPEKGPAVVAVSRGRPRRRGRQAGR